MGRTKNTPAKTTGTAEHCPEVREAMLRLQYRQAHVLGPMLRALELLADSQRVLHDLGDAARYDEAFRARLSKACAGWSNPLGLEDGDSGYSALQDLARVAGETAAEIAEGMDALIWNGAEGGAA